MDETAKNDRTRMCVACDRITMEREILPGHSGLRVVGVDVSVKRYAPILNIETYRCDVCRTLWAFDHDQWYWIDRNGRIR